MIGADRLDRNWQARFFSYVDADSAALLRIAFGVLGLISLFGLTPVSMYWSIGGLVPQGGGGTGIRSVLLQHDLGSVIGWTLWLGMVAVFVLLTAGYRTRPMTVACVAGLILQAHWNRLPLSMAWQVQTCVLFCLLFADAGAVLSLDAWKARGAGVTSQSRSPLWPLLLIRYQVVLIYFSSGLWKLAGSAWRDGSALHYVLNNHAFYRFPGLLTPPVEWIATLGTYVTLAWELAFPLVLLHPVLRRIGLTIGVAIHAGIWLTMEVGTFSWVMVASYIAFLEPDAVSRVIRRLSGRRLAVHLQP
jgi:hypothetical protein